MHRSTAPGLEKEELSPNHGGQAQSLRWPARRPTSSPLVGRREKPGASARDAAGPPSAAGVLQPSARGLALFGSHQPASSFPAPPSSPSAWTDAGAAAHTVSHLYPSNSGFETIEGPAPKRARLAACRGSGLQQSGGGSCALTAGAADSDSDGEDEAVSRKHPTPVKAPAAAAATAVEVGPPALVRVQHPPPTWAASMLGGGGSACVLARSAQVQQSQMAGADKAGMAEADVEWSEGGESDMEEDVEDSCMCGASEWQRLPLPHPLDVEE